MDDLTQRLSNGESTGIRRLWSKMSLILAMAAPSSMLMIKKGIIYNDISMCTSSRHCSLNAAPWPAWLLNSSLSAVGDKMLD